MQKWIACISVVFVIGLVLNCCTQVLKDGVKAGSLAPLHIIEPEYSDYAEGRDVVMEWIYQQELP